MKNVKEVRIRIVSDRENYLKERKKVLADIESGKKINLINKKTIVFTPKVFAKVFSPEKIRLIHMIQNNKINSITHLAKTLNRSFEAVDRDIKYLEGMNLVTLRKNEKAKIPMVAKELHLII